MISIREERENDKELVYKLVKDAFSVAEHSDGDEQNLVNRLRKSESFIKELSLVAEIGNDLAGHIMFTKIIIENEKEKYESLALAPLSVLPKYQNRGVGSKLVNEGLKMAKELGFNSVIVLGSENYYPRFGFKESYIYGIKAPFEVPKENFMVIELKENGLNKVSGVVKYSKEFF